MSEAKTEVEVAYEYIGVSPAGDHFIKELTPEAYEANIRQWPVLLKNYFDAIAEMRG